MNLDVCKRCKNNLYYNGEQFYCCPESGDFELNYIDIILSPAQRVYLFKHFKCDVWPIGTLNETMIDFSKAELKDSDIEFFSHIVLNDSCPYWTEHILTDWNAKK